MVLPLKEVANHDDHHNHHTKSCDDHQDHHDDDQDEIVVHFGGIICMVSVSDAVAQPELAR